MLLYMEVENIKERLLIKEICSLMIKGGFHEQFNGNIYNIEGETFPLKEVAALIANKIGVAVSFIS